jgi:hypothetical protein
MKIDMTLPFDEPTDTMSGRSKWGTRPLNKEDIRRTLPSTAPRCLKDIPEKFRKPKAPPGKVAP